MQSFRGKMCRTYKSKKVSDGARAEQSFHVRYNEPVPLSIAAIEIAWHNGIFDFGKFALGLNMMSERAPLRASTSFCPFYEKHRNECGFLRPFFDQHRTFHSAFASSSFCVFCRFLWWRNITVLTFRQATDCSFVRFSSAIQLVWYKFLVSCWIRLQVNSNAFYHFLVVLSLILTHTLSRLLC